MSEIAKSRKELTAEYKQTKQAMGVYQIRNLANDKVYVASSPNLSAIWNREQFQLELGGHPNAALQAEYKEFGKDQFVFEILHELRVSDETPNPKDELKALEVLTIEELQPFGERGYNKPKKP